MSQSNCESEFEEVEIDQKASNDLCNQEEFLPDYRIENRVDQQNTLNIEQNIESDIVIPRCNHTKTLSYVSI